MTALLGGEDGYSGMLWVPITSATSAEQRTIAHLEGMYNFIEYGLSFAFTVDVSYHIFLAPSSLLRP